MKKSILAVALTASMAQSVFAAPDETTEKLINDSISILDWGLFRLENQIARDLPNLPAFFDLSPKVFTQYDLDADELIISVETKRPHSIFNNTEYSTSELRNLCAYAVNSIKREAGVDPETGTYRYGTESKYIRSFSHNGYVHEKYRFDPTELDKKFSISVWLGMFNCQSKLMSTSMTFDHSAK